MKSEDLTKWREIATMFSLVAIPVVVAVMQWISAHAAVNQQYVSLAIQILSSTPDAKGVSNSDLRSWAVDVINAKAPITFPESVRSRLVSGELRLTGTAAITECPDPVLGVGSTMKAAPGRQ